MSGTAFSHEDVTLMIEGLESLKQYSGTGNSLARIDALQKRLYNRFPSFTLGELKNICLGLENLLDMDPLDYRCNELLSRLRSEFGIPKQL